MGADIGSVQKSDKLHQSPMELNILDGLAYENEIQTNNVLLLMMKLMYNNSKKNNRAPDELFLWKT